LEVHDTRGERGRKKKINHSFFSLAELARRKKKKKASPVSAMASKRVSTKGENRRNVSFSIPQQRGGGKRNLSQVVAISSGRKGNFRKEEES